MLLEDDAVLADATHPPIDHQTSILHQRAGFDAFCTQSTIPSD
jgi:hypothetical protein